MNNFSIFFPLIMTCLAGIYNFFANNLKYLIINYYFFIPIYLNHNWKVLINLANQSESKKISVNSTISLKGIVKAIFNDTVHVQIGGKIIPIPAADFFIEKPSK